MLASLLPGLRDVRTPLATGYLWLLALWFLLHDILPKSIDESSGPAKALFELGEWLGTAAVLAALSFAAYLLGSLLAVTPSNRLLNLGSRIVGMDSHGSSQGARYRLERQIYNRTTSNQPDRLTRQLQLVVRKYIDDADQQVRSTSDDEKLKFHKEVLVAREPRLYPGFGWFSPDDIPRLYLLQIVEDFPAIGVQLQAKNRDLWDTYDRHSAEAQFRLAITAPIVAIAVILAVQSNIFWLLLLVIPIYLPVLGLRQSINATSVLVQAVALRMVEPPVLERLNEQVSRALPTQQSVRAGQIPN